MDIPCWSLRQKQTEEPEANEAKRYGCQRSWIIISSFEQVGQEAAAYRELKQDYTDNDILSDGDELHLRSAERCTLGYPAGYDAVQR